MVAKKAEKIRKDFDNKFKSGFALLDIIKQQWELGDLIGRGGFGNVYVAHPVGNNLFINDINSNFSAKIEPLSNGPLFTEIAFYQRVATKEKIKEWCQEKNLAFLGIPTYIASGSGDKTTIQHRFIILPRLGQNVEQIWVENGNKFTISTMYQIGLRLLECLEYIHHLGYSHGDIKASNLMTGYLDTLSDAKIYLMDFGLAASFLSSGNHKPYKEDPKRKHDGTIEYTSIDAHMGAIVSRRGDLINLALVLVHLYIKDLPWLKFLEDKEKVLQEKLKFLKEPHEYLMKITQSNQLDSLGGLISFIKSCSLLSYTEVPSYQKLSAFLKSSHDKYASKYLKDINTKCHTCLVEAIPNTSKPSKRSSSLRRRLELDELNICRRNPARVAKRVS